MEIKTVTLKLLTLTTLLLVCAITRAQSIETDVIEWTANHLTDLNAGVDTTYNCKFLTKPNDTIEWIQGDYVVVMAVNSSFGQWADIKSDGSYTFDVWLSDKRGSIIFSRAAGITTVLMQFIEGSSNKLPFKFNINETTKLEQ